jgi:hypothetical protein
VSETAFIRSIQSQTNAAKRNGLIPRNSIVRPLTALVNQKVLHN